MRQKCKTKRGLALHRERLYCKLWRYCFYISGALLHELGAARFWDELRGYIGGCAAVTIASEPKHNDRACSLPLSLRFGSFDKQTPRPGPPARPERLLHALAPPATTVGQAFKPHVVNWLLLSSSFILLFKLQSRQTRTTFQTTPTKPNNILGRIPYLHEDMKTSTCSTASSCSRAAPAAASSAAPAPLPSASPAAAAAASSSAAPAPSSSTSPGAAASSSAAPAPSSSASPAASSAAPAPSCSASPAAAAASSAAPAASSASPGAAAASAAPAASSASPAAAASSAGPYGSQSCGQGELRYDSHVQIYLHMYNYKDLSISISMYIYIYIYTYTYLHTCI